MSEIKPVSEAFPIQSDLSKQEQSEHQSTEQDASPETQSIEEVVNTSKRDQLAQDAESKKNELWDKLKKFEANKKESA